MSATLEYFRNVLGNKLDTHTHTQNHKRVPFIWIFSHIANLSLPGHQDLLLTKSYLGYTERELLSDLSKPEMLSNCSRNPVGLTLPC